MTNSNKNSLSLSQELRNIGMELNLDQGQGFGSAFNFNSGFSNGDKSKKNNLDTGFTNDFSKPTRSTGFAPAMQSGRLKTGLKVFKPEDDVNKENNIKQEDIYSSGSKFSSMPQNTSFSSAKSTKSNNLQPDKQPLSSGPTNSQSLHSATKPMLKPIHTNINQVKNSNNSKLQAPSLLNKNIIHKTGISLNNGQTNSPIPKKFISPMKNPQYNIASKKPSSGFKPFVSPYKSQTKLPTSEIPAKRPTNTNYKPVKRHLYSNSELYNPENNIEREKAIGNKPLQEFQQSTSQMIRPVTNNLELLNTQQLSMMSNGLLDNDSIGPLYENEITQWQRSQLDPEILEMDLEKAANYSFTSKPATSSIKTAHFGSSLSWIHISDILDKLSSINKKQLDEWVKNQYSMVVWKTASYVRSYPVVFSSYWDWSFIFEQVKLRFRREILEKKSSCLKMIVEYLSPSLRYFIAIVSKVTIEENNSAEIVISDGWYTIRCRLDGVLTKAVNSGAITIGMKLAICGAALESPGYMPVLESYNEVELKINGNGTRRAKWDAQLGFQDGLYYPIHLSNIDSMGGNVTAIDTIVLRKYPLKFVESVSSDKKIFRTESEEIQYCTDLEERYQNYDTLPPSSPPENIHREVSCSFKVLVKDSNCQNGNQYAMITFWNTSMESYEDLKEFTKLAFFNLRPYNRPNMKKSSIVQLSTTSTTRWKAQETAEVLNISSDKNFRHVMIPNEFSSYEIEQDVDLIAYYAGNILNGQCFIDQEYNVYLVQLSPYTSKECFSKLKIGQITGLTDLKRGPRDEKFDLNIFKQYSETKIYKKPNAYFKERWTQMENYLSANEYFIKQRIEKLHDLNMNIQLGKVVGPQLQAETPVTLIEKSGKFISFKFKFDHTKVIGKYRELESSLIKFVMDIENWIEITKNAYSEFDLSELKTYLIEKLDPTGMENHSTLVNMIQSMTSVEDILTKVYKEPVEELYEKWNIIKDDIFFCRWEFVDLLSYQLMTNIYQASFSKLNYPNGIVYRDNYFKVEKLNLSPKEFISESMAKLFI